MNHATNHAFRLRLVSASLMSMLMSFLMTAWVTWLNIGIRPDFLARWAHAFLAAWPAAFVIVVLCAPAVQGFSLRLVQRLAGCSAPSAQTSN